MGIKSFMFKKNNSPSIWSERTEKMTFRMTGSTAEEKQANLDNARTRSFAKGGRAILNSATQAADSTKAYFREGSEKYSAQRKGEQPRDASYFMKRGTTLAIKSPMYAGIGIGMGVVLTGKGVAKGATIAGKGVAKGATIAGKGVAEGATFAGKGVAKGATFAGKGVAKGATAAGKGIAEGSSWTSASVVGAGRTVALNAVPLMNEAAHKVHTAGVSTGAVLGVYAAAEQANKAYAYSKESALDGANYMKGWSSSVAKTFSTASFEGRQSRDKARVARQDWFKAESPSLESSFMSRSSSRQSSQTSSSIKTVSTDDLFKLPLPILTGASLGFDTKATSLKGLMGGAGHFGSVSMDTPAYVYQYGQAF